MVHWPALLPCRIRTLKKIFAAFVLSPRLRMRRRMTKKAPAGDIQNSPWNGASATNDSPVHFLRRSCNFCIELNRINKSAISGISNRKHLPITHSKIPLFRLRRRRSRTHRHHRYRCRHHWYRRCRHRRNRHQNRHPHHHLRHHRRYRHPHRR